MPPARQGDYRRHGVGSEQGGGTPGPRAVQNPAGGEEVLVWSPPIAVAGVGVKASLSSINAFVQRPLLLTGGSVLGPVGIGKV